MNEDEEIDRLARLAEQMAEAETDYREVAYEQSLCEMPIQIAIGA